MVELAVLAAGIPERTTCHSFATHLPKDDSDIRNVQELQGHQDAATTVLDEQIYTLLRQKFGEHLSKVRISLGVKIRESTSHHTTIIEHAGASDHAAQFLEFTRAMIARMEKSLTEAPQRGDQTTPASGSDATDELAVGEVSHG